MHQAEQNEKMTCRQNGKAPPDNQQDAKARNTEQNDYEIKQQKHMTWCV